MRDNKFVLPILIILLIIFLPAAIYGTMQNVKVFEKKVVHPHKENGVLYYYDDNNNLVGSYTCISDECDDAKNDIDEENFNYDTGSLEYIGVFGASNVLIKDEGVIKLYNLKLQKEMRTFAKMKNYDTKIAGKYVILVDETDHYGLLDLDHVIFSIPFEEQYEYIGVCQNYLNANPDNLKLAVKATDGYYIVSPTGEELSSAFVETIYDYTDEYVITNGPNETYRIYNYGANMLLSDTIEIKKYEKIDNIYIILLSTGDIWIYPDGFNSDHTEFKAQGTTLSYRVDGDVINILNGDVVMDTYQMNSSQSDNNTEQENFDF